MDKLMEKELAVFKTGEKYNFTKDMKDAYKSHLKLNLEDKIFKTIPDHYFWDIKKPNQKRSAPIQQNRYNPFRGNEYDNFFEMVEHEEYMEEQMAHKNLNNSVSMFRKY